MKKTHARTLKLALHRETVRALVGEELRQADGGLATNFCTRANSCDPETVYACPGSRLVTC